MIKLKKIISIFILCLLFAGCNASNEKPVEKLERKKLNNIVSNELKNGLVKIKIIVDDKEVIAELENNPTTQNLIEQLPITTTFEDFNNSEKITYFPESLNGSKSNNNYAPKKGDLACYEPWGNLAVYYHNSASSSELSYIGHIDEGLELLSNKRDNFKARIELIE